MKSHKCMAIGCKIDLPQSKLMCARHWKGTPAEIRTAVLEGYASRRAGESGGAEAHLAAVRKAIKYWLLKQDEAQEVKEAI